MEIEKKELIENLKSSLNTKIEGLEAVQAEGIKALAELDEANESGDEAKVTEASEKVEKIGVDIVAAQKSIDDVKEQIDWFKEYKPLGDTPEEGQTSDETRVAQMKALFDELKTGVVSNGAKLTVGQNFANILKHRGLRRWENFHDVQAGVKMTALLGKDFEAAKELKETKSLKDIKSIYTNHGVELLDENDDPVPGFVSYQCGLVEDTSLTCLLEPPKEDFEECITQATMPTGNRIRFTREVSRDENVGSVLETVYNPYPDFAQDGTKPESVFTLATVEVNDSKVASFVTASDEVLDDCPSVASLIDNFLISAVNKEKRRQLIAGTGLAGTYGGVEMRGILNQPDVLTRTHQDAGDGGTADDNIYDTFRRALTDLWLQAANVESVCVIMNPRDLEIIDLAKDEMGRYLFNDSDCFNRQLRCLKIRVSTNIPQGTAVMGDFANNWVFYTRKALDIRMGYTGDQFITNTNTILAEFRGLSLLRCPRKVIKIDGLSA